MKIIRRFELEKETKGALRYKEITKNGTDVIGTIYFRKTAFKNGEWPSKIKIVVTSVEE